jgi:Zn-dependent metalloprotease
MREGGIMRAAMTALWICILATVAQAEMRPGLTAEAKAARVASAREKVAAHINANLATLGLASTLDLRETGNNADSFSVTLRYRQLHAGIPVLYGDLILVVTSDVQVRSNQIKQALSVNVEPQITGADALKLALTASGLRGRAESSDPALIIVPKGSFGQASPSTDSLAWEIDIFRTNDDQPPAYSHRFYIDAHTGQTIADLNQVAHAALHAALVGVPNRQNVHEWDRRTRIYDRCREGELGGELQFQKQHAH